MAIRPEPAAEDLADGPKPGRPDAPLECMHIRRHASPTQRGAPVVLKDGIQVDGHNDDAVAHHLIWLIEGGYIDGEHQNGAFVIRRLVAGLMPGKAVTLPMDTSSPGQGLRPILNCLVTHRRHPHAYTQNRKLLLGLKNFRIRL